MLALLARVEGLAEANEAQAVTITQQRAQIDGYGTTIQELNSTVETLSSRLDQAIAALNQNNRESQLSSQESNLHHGTHSSKGWILHTHAQGEKSVRKGNKPRKKMSPTHVVVFSHRCLLPRRVDLRYVCQHRQRQRRSTSFQSNSDQRRRWVSALRSLKSHTDPDGRAPSTQMTSGMSDTPRWVSFVQTRITSTVHWNLQVHRVAGDFQCSPWWSRVVLLLHLPDHGRGRVRAVRRRHHFTGWFEEAVWNLGGQRRERRRRCRAHGLQRSRSAGRR